MAGHRSPGAADSPTGGLVVVVVVVEGAAAAVQVPCVVRGRLGGGPVPGRKETRTAIAISHVAMTRVSRRGDGAVQTALSLLHPLPARADCTRSTLLTQADRNHNLILAPCHAQYGIH